MLNILMEFLIIFIVCYLLYLLFTVARKKKRKFNPKKPSMDEVFLTMKFKIDFKKVNYVKYLNLVALVNSFILALTFILVQIVKGVFFQILISIIFLIPLILISYTIIGKHYQKKGMILNV